MHLQLSLADARSFSKKILGKNFFITELLINRVKISSLTSSRSRLSGLLCYSLGWVTGLIMLGRRKIDGFVCFHAWQSIIAWGILSLILIVPVVVMLFVTLKNAVLAWSLVSMYWVMIIFAAYLWVFLMLKAYDGHTYKLFIVGDLALNLSRLTTINLMLGKPAGDRHTVNGYRPAAESIAGGEQKTEGKVEVSQELYSQMTDSIVTLYKQRDPYTALHQERVAQLACAIAGEIGCSQDRISGIHTMALIHDIGKIAVPSETLSKSGTLNNYEIGIIRTHPEVAFNIVRGLPFPWPVAQVIFQHHERLNGSGYPQGIAGDKILLEARILSVSDVVEAMATHRPYRPALGMQKALQEIKKHRGTLYDADVVDACIRLINDKGFGWDMQV